MTAPLPVSVLDPSLQTEDCPICLDPCGDEIARLSCGHLGHYDCLKEWLRMNESCPLGRLQVKTLTRPEDVHPSLLKIQKLWRGAVVRKRMKLDPNFVNFWWGVLHETKIRQEARMVHQVLAGSLGAEIGELANGGHHFSSPAPEDLTLGLLRLPISHLSLASPRGIIARRERHDHPMLRPGAIRERERYSEVD